MSAQAKSRAPAAFDPDDPALVVAAERAADTVAGEPAGPIGEAAAPYAPLATVARRGVRWGALLMWAGGVLATMALGLWFARFVSIAFTRDDWLGWVSLGLIGAMALAGIMLIGREALGFVRLGRLRDIRSRADRALTASDITLERAVVADVKSLLGGRGGMAWHLARFREHEGDVHDGGALLALADRELVAPLDVAARSAVALAAKRVGVVTAVSPAALVAMGYVAFENIRLMRTLASNYGGRPGLFGSLRLARLVFGHIVATGGVALTDDLLGQFLGQDILRRLSRRLGEGLFNGALTVRVGVAAIEVCRPLPFIAAKPVRARDFAAELIRRSEAKSEPRS